MPEVVHTALRVRRVRSTLLLHALLSFHKERLRRQRIGSYAGQFPEPATPDPAMLFDQAERLPLDQRRHLIDRLLAKMPPDEEWLAGRKRTRVAKALDERKRRAS
jgi:hypothetical protein